MLVHLIFRHDIIILLKRRQNEYGITMVIVGLTSPAVRLSRRHEYYIFNTPIEFFFFHGFRVI